MAKITLDPHGSGYQSAAAHNSNNEVIEAEFQDKVLYRDNLAGEPNTMEQDLDMNSNQVTNLSAPSNNTDAVRLQDLQDAASDVGSTSALLVSVSDSEGLFASSNVEGSLEELGAAITTDTVNSLKLLSPAVGQRVSTKGYHVVGDGGGAIYLIVAPQSFDGYGDHELANSNIAVLQYSGAINSQWFGAKLDYSNNDAPAINAAIQALDSVTGGDVIIPPGKVVTEEPIVNGARKVNLILSKGTFLYPSVDIDVIRITTPGMNVLGGGVINGEDVASGSGNGIVIGYGTSDARSTRIECSVINMRGHGLVWQDGPSSHIRGTFSENDGDGVYCPQSGGDDSNHGVFEIHCSNNGGYGLNIGDSGSGDRSRHHVFTMVKAFGNLTGGVYVGGSECVGNIFTELNTGNQLEFGASSFGNAINLDGVAGVIDTYIDPTDKNTVYGVDANDRANIKNLRFIDSFIDNSDYTASLKFAQDASNNFEIESQSSNNVASELNIRHQDYLNVAARPSSILTTKFDRISVNDGSPLIFFKHGSASLDFGTVGANSYVDRTITVTDAATTHRVILVQNQPAGIIATAWVSASDTVTIRANNVTGSGIAINATQRVTVIS